MQRISIRNCFSYFLIKSQVLDTKMLKTASRGIFVKGFASNAVDQCSSTSRDRPKSKSFTANRSVTSVNTTNHNWMSRLTLYGHAKEPSLLNGYECFVITMSS